MVFIHHKITTNTNNFRSSLPPINQKENLSSSNSNQVKCPKCFDTIDYQNSYLISNSASSSNNSNNKIKYLLSSIKNYNIQEYLIQHIGYKTIFILKEIDKILELKSKIKKEYSKVWFLIFNTKWIDFLKNILPDFKFNLINFININTLNINKNQIETNKFIKNNFLHKNSKIYILEPLNPDNKLIIHNFINNLEILKHKINLNTNKNTNKNINFKIISLVLKNTLDEKIFNNQVILN